jgi:hypothetical protein
MHTIISYQINHKDFIIMNDITIEFRKNLAEDIRVYFRQGDNLASLNCIHLFNNPTEALLELPTKLVLELRGDHYIIPLSKRDSLRIHKDGENIGFFHNELPEFSWKNSEFLDYENAPQDLLECINYCFELIKNNPIDYEDHPIDDAIFGYQIVNAFGEIHDSEDNKVKAFDKFDSSISLGNARREYPKNRWIIKLISVSQSEKYSL